MKKSEYLKKLEDSLIKNCVPDIDDIIAEYEHHFDMKLAEGYTEEEISMRLADPKQIAEQYAPQTASKQGNKGVKAILTFGITLLDIAVFCVFITLYAWVIVIGAFAVSSFFAAFFLTAGMRFNEVIIPYMPYAGALLMALTLVALSVLAAITTLFSHLYTVRFVKVYLRWHRNTLSSAPLPPLTLKMELSAKFIRKTRKLMALSAIVFAVTFVIANIVLFAYADFQPYWHHWNWFQ